MMMVINHTCRESNDSTTNEVREPILALLQNNRLKSNFFSKNSKIIRSSETPVALNHVAQ